MSGPWPAGQHPEDPIPKTPGMEQLFRALTAEGDAAELVGRQAALTMFRAVHSPAASPEAAAPAPEVPDGGVLRGQRRRQRGPRGPGPQGPTRPGGRSRRRRPWAILAGIAAAMLVACAALVAAAYTAVLPGRMQEFAHAVLARVGVPRAAPAPAAGYSPSAGPSSPANPNAPGNSPAFIPTPSTSGQNVAGSVTVSVRARRAEVPFGNSDLFAGNVTTAGRADAGIRVLLLERLAAGDGAWRLAATGVTQPGGTVTLTVPRVTGNATFRLSGTGPLAAASSPPVAVSVLPRLVVRVPAAGVLTAAAWPAAAGDAVVLQERQDGTWRVIATHYLDSLHKATFTVASGATYRVVLPATTAHEAGRSAPVLVPAMTAAAPRQPPLATSAPIRRPGSRV